VNSLDKFVEKNKNHENKLAREKKDTRKLIPIAIGCLIIYLAWAYYTTVYQGTFDDGKLNGLLISLWMLTIVVSVGTGALFLAFSLAIIFYVQNGSKMLDRRVSSPKLMLFSASILFISLLFFKLAEWLSGLIVEHAYSISRFLKLGFLETPYLFVIITNFIIFIIAFKYFFWFVRIAIFPLRAKADVEKYSLE
jgi:hypothetical protein